MTAIARPRVFIVEDEFLIAMSIEDVVQELGYEVIGPVARFDDALRVAKTAEIDVAILDVSLDRGQLVFPVAEVLRTRSIPFAFLTAYGREILDSHFRDRRIIEKPFDGGVLARCLRELTNGVR